MSPRSDQERRKWWHARIRDASTPVTQFSMAADYMRAVLKNAPAHAAERIIPGVADTIRDAADEIAKAPPEPEDEDEPPEG